MEKKNIGIVVMTNSDITDLASLCLELKKRQFPVFLFAWKNIKTKPHYSIFLHQEHLQKIYRDKIVWFHDHKDLADKLTAQKVEFVFTKEAMPLVQSPNLFKIRPYKVYSLVHSVDNFHQKAIDSGVLDLSFVGYEKYGEYLGWDKKDYVALGLPKYDVISSLNVNEIREKYQLPEKYVLLLAPNNNLLNTFVIYKIIRKIRAGGYDVILKGKTPKCHRKLYGFMARKYFLSDFSFYPFITHELIFASSGVVGFDTTAVEEILMCERPLVNFSIKPYRDKVSREGNFKQFVPMWNAPYCMDIPFFDHRRFGIFKKIPDFLHHFEKKINYKKIQEEVFSIPGSASKRIVDFLEKEIS